MATDALSRVAMRLLHAARTGILHIEIVSHEDVDQRLEERHPT